MKIVRVTVTPIAVQDPPLLNASGIHEPFALRSIVQIESDSGYTGLGETYGDAPVLRLLERAAPRLVGIDPWRLNAIRTAVLASADARTAAGSVDAQLAPGTQPLKAATSVYGAFEVACLDLQARALGVPLVDLLGGAVRDAVPFSAYLFFKYAEHRDAPYAPDTWGQALTPDQIVAQARRMIDTCGFGSIKLKAGVLPPDDEIACMRALRAAYPALPLRIDPNAAWSLDTAERMARELEGTLEYYEDPTPGLEGMAELHRRTGLPLATNMVVTTFEEFRRSVSLGAVQIVLADHHYWGGLRDSQILARMCATFGLGVSMHSNSHLGISLMAMSHLAASVPNLSYACDTHYPWQRDEDEVVAGGKVPIVDGCVRIGTAPGLGVDLDPERLAAAHEAYLSCGIRQRDDVGQMRKYDAQWAGTVPRF